MAVNLTVNGVTYAFPTTGDQSWGSTVSNWATAITSGMLQKAGGTFTLTAEVDFGASYGIKSLYYKSRTANPASAGQIRLGNTDTIKWRNALNNADFSLSLNSSNQFVFDSVLKVTDTTDSSSTTTGSIITSGGIGAAKSLQVGTTASSVHAINGLTTLTSPNSGFILTLVKTTGNDPHIKFSSGGSTDYKIGLTSGVFEFLNNGNDIRGSVNQDGLWTLGTASGTQTHVANGQVSIVAGASGFPLTMSKSGSDPHIKFDIGGSNDIKIGITSGGAFEVLNNGNSVLGTVSQAGQWTLGIGTGTQSGPKIYGVNDGTTATAGTIGQCISARITSASNYAATGVWGNLTSIALTKGHWLVSGTVISDLNGATCTALDMALSAFSGVTTTDQQPGDNELEYGPPTATYDSSMSIPSWEVNISSDTTHYIKGRATYSAGVPRFRCRISAVRIR